MHGLLRLVLDHVSTTTHQTLDVRPTESSCRSSWLKTHTQQERGNDQARSARKRHQRTSEAGVQEGLVHAQRRPNKSPWLPPRHARRTRALLAPHTLHPYSCAAFGPGRWPWNGRSSRSALLLLLIPPPAATLSALSTLRTLRASPTVSARWSARHRRSSWPAWPACLLGLHHLAEHHGASLPRINTPRRQHACGSIRRVCVGVNRTEREREKSA
eukprot:159519-Rhodomonas_salina.3